MYFSLSVIVLKAARSESMDNASVPKPIPSTSKTTAMRTSQLRLRDDTQHGGKDGSTDSTSEYNRLELLRKSFRILGMGRKIDESKSEVSIKFELEQKGAWPSINNLRITANSHCTIEF